MKILSIETSCDETAVSIIEATGGVDKPQFSVLSNLVLSQIKLHEQYGGVFPNLAKREHSKNLGPLIKKALEEAGVSEIRTEKTPLDTAFAEQLRDDLAREPELVPSLFDIFETMTVPTVDLIAVTYGPGLEPALWVGINAAKALSKAWSIPVLPVNHMEGHISSVFLDSGTSELARFPAIALLISGGHTELVLVPDWLSYTVIGETRDDAVGEAFDKVARMLGLPYPGGPKISALAAEAREANKTHKPEHVFTFPRPMINSGNLDFSFSGLKTSVLYAIEKIVDLDLETKKQIALGFEDAVIETLIEKTCVAIEQYDAQTLIVAGGVIANKTLRAAFEKLVQEFPGVKILVPTHALSTDNALMIALAAYIRKTKRPQEVVALDQIKAEGNVRLG